jgi:hypothetical protein
VDRLQREAGMIQLRVGRLVCLCALLLAAVAAPGSSRADQCWDDRNACTDRADEAQEECSAGCDARFPGDLDRWESCFDRCNNARDRAIRQCDRDEETCRSNAARRRSPPDTPSRARDNAAARGFEGQRAQGQDGCYFGECPNDLQRKIEQAPPAPSSPQQQPPANPQIPVPQQQGSRMSWICQTPGFWCRMFVQGPVGYSCSCQNPFGFPPLVPGIIVPGQ